MEKNEREAPLIWIPGGNREPETPPREEQEFSIPRELPLLPTRDVVAFPFMILPLFVGREASIKAVDEALSRDRLIFLVAQKRAEIEEPTPQDIHQVGTVGMIMRMLKLPDGRIKILVQGLAKGRIEEFTQIQPFYRIRISILEEPEIKETTLETEALVRSVREGLEKAVSLGKAIPPDLVVVANNLEDPGKLADLVASNLGLKVEDAQQILETLNPMDRLKRVAQILYREIELLTVQQKIQTEAKEEMGRLQREYFLREQLKAIQKELGEGDEREEEVKEFEEKIRRARMPKDVGKEARRQLKRLAKMHPDSAEATVVRTYLEWLTELPWKKSTRDTLDVKAAKEILDEDHYDLEKVKDRILEYLSVLKLKKSAKGPILCFVGPPGVGKTSLGRSIARALGRKFVRISLGGVRDEAEIRGHRRTYIGALPGKIIQGIKQAGSNNPVFMLDEVDKLGIDFRGDPSSALLEVLDPEQNHAFVDHYLGVPFDLSKVMFICTANIMDTIPSPLLDRMEVIEIPGYTEEDKVAIAKRYLIPRQREANGLNEKDISFSDEAIRKIIRLYTREAGLRNLEREIGSICRKVARRIAEGEEGPFKITAKSVERYLGSPRHHPETETMKEDEVGVAIGLAWTPTGGDIIHVEATVMPGKGKLTLTGQLGDVMKESAMAAVDYIRTRASQMGIPEDFYYKHDFHIHVPAGAIPKDGPSAGVTIATALISTLTNIPAKKDIAMTGEITLTGRVLPIGGLREKSLAAKRAGIRKVIIPRKNLVDLTDMPEEVKKSITFLSVEHMDQVVELALQENPMKEVPAFERENH